MKSLNDSLEEYKKINYNKNSLQSYSKFMQRLKTFEMCKWFAKPAEFSPIECARHGWFNLTKDTLKCISCSNILFFCNPPLSSMGKSVKCFNNEKNPVKSTNWSDPQRLLDEHNQNCPWRALSVPDQFIQIDIYDEELMFKRFIDLLKSYQNAVGSNLPKLDQRTVEIFDSIACLKREKSAILNEIPSKRKTILACCGWTHL